RLRSGAADHRPLRAPLSPQPGSGRHHGSPGRVDPEGRARRGNRRPGAGRGGAAGEQGHRRRREVTLDATRAGRRRRAAGRAFRPRPAEVTPVIPAALRCLRRMHRRHYLHAYAFISPVIVLFAIFRVWPSMQTLYFSFFKVELLRHRLTFLGFGNFLDMVQDAVFRQALRNTLVYAAVIVPASAALAMVLAVLFTEEFRLKEVFKAVYFSPTVTSTTAAAVVWWWMYNPQYGLINVLLKLAHLPPQPLLLSSHMALSAVIIFSVWKAVGCNMVIYIAGLQAISAMFYEARTRDGASSLQRFLSITIPLLAPTT